MSRIQVFGWDGYRVGEFVGTVNRGWAVNSGGTASVVISARTALKPWLQPGCIALIEDDAGKLPAWAGVFDTDWKIVAPLSLALYDIPYLLKYRQPDAALTLTGTVYSTLFFLVQQANLWSDSLVRVADISIGDQTTISQAIETRSIWDQMCEIAKKYNGEITFQPTVDPSTNRLTVLMMARKITLSDPVDLLEDGERGNMVVTEASAAGVIVNHIVGTSDESTAASRRKFGPIRDDASIRRYGLRQVTAVFSGIKDNTSLETATRAYLTQNAYPRVRMTINVIDRGDIFTALRIGNILRIHSSRVILPGGIRGWEGLARITAMSFDESEKVMSLSIEGAL